MCIRKLLIAAALAAIILPGPALAAPSNTASAEGKALLLLPLTLTKIDDLDFGTIVSSNSSGTVALNATSGARTFAGGVSGVPSAASRISPAASDPRVPRSLTSPCS